jgi:hydrogenase expression/formation protein HypD
VQVAVANPANRVIFFAAGFETTAAPVAAMVAAGIPDNLSLLLSLRRTWPAVAMLLDSESPGFEALIAPGHVATIMGADEWDFVVRDHRMPAAVAGFTAASVLAALHAVLVQIRDRRPRLQNAYPEFVRPAGNPRAQACLEAQFEAFDAPWRGIGTIAQSGFVLRPQLAAHDAREIFPDIIAQAPSGLDVMPPGCDCARVVMGRLAPAGCRLYGKACTPRSPIGPCMVSDEGACHIWWASGQRVDQHPSPAGVTHRRRGAR